MLSFATERYRSVILKCVMISSLVITGCNYLSPGTKTPLPRDNRLKKSFFANFDADGNITEQRTFLGGWMAETTAGKQAFRISNHIEYAGHCNMEFHVKKIDHNSYHLVGLRVNPSFPYDRDRWDPVITIPITKQYYYRKSKDQYDRETNEYIEDDSEDDPSRRPYMNLNLAGIHIHDWSMAIFGLESVQGGHRIESIEDVEWSENPNYLAFTITVFRGSQIAPSGSHIPPMKGKFRFNFLEFKHDTTFVPTPYADQNSKFLNVLFIIGAKANGDRNQEVTYAARWDTRRTHDVNLVGFPDEYLPIGKEILELWNDEFEAIGHGRPFRPIVKKMKYGFDLRYPSITWVSDPGMSEGSPIGIAMANADVRNGKILWGGVTLWGGALERYVKYYVPSAPVANTGSSLAGESTVQLSLLDLPGSLPDLRPAVPGTLTTPLPVSEIRRRLRQSYLSELDGLNYLKSKLEKHGPGLPVSGDAIPRPGDEINGLDNYDPLKDYISSLPSAENVRYFEADRMVSKRIDSLNTSLEKMDPWFDRMAREYHGLYVKSEQLQSVAGFSGDIYNADFLQRLIGYPTLQESYEYLPFSSHRQMRDIVAGAGRLSKDTIIKSLRGSYKHQSFPLIFDLDYTFGDVAMGWKHAQVKKGIDWLSALKPIIKDKLLHEWGHVVGLGHNFEQNVLPDRGTVPDKYLDGDESAGNPADREGLLARATEERGYVNTTSVMGYRHGLTDVMFEYEDVKPGSHDRLVLRYIYNREYPVFPVSPEPGEDFVYVPLKKDGIIRKEQSGVTRRDSSFDHRKFRVAYFRACNDFEASWSEDPYCNRFDRGADAVSITRGYLDDLKGNIISRLYAFTDTVKGSHHWLYENWLWNVSLDTFGRVRVFYDYMRMKYKDLIKDQIAKRGEEGIGNLMDFSTACRDDIPESERKNTELRKLFNNNVELKKLCIASGNIMRELEFFLTLPGSDFTKVNRSDRYVTASVFGGDVEGRMGRAWGRWTELARTPIKISALLAMTSPTPFVNFYGWLLPLPSFSSGSDGWFLMNTFYPKEFSRAIASTVENNLTFGSAKLNDRTKIGKAVLSLGYFLRNNFRSNDVLGVDMPYITNIRNQTDFRYSYAMIDIGFEDPEKKERARKFTGTIHNIYSQGPESLSEVYLYTNDRTVIMPPAMSLLYPVTSVRWYSPTRGYYFAFKLDYADDFYDRFKTNSVRKTLEHKYHEIMNTCVQGSDRNGLRFFFNDSIDENIFPGFEAPETLHLRKTSRDRFYRSIENQFKRYYSNAGEFTSTMPDPMACEEALRGQGLLVMAASALSGFYLDGISDFVEQGQ